VSAPRRRRNAFLLAPEARETSTDEELDRPLDAREQRVLAAAIRLAEKTAREVERGLLELGQWILENVFDGDSEAALTGRRKSRVWHELTRLAGSAALPLSERLLHVALSIAAHDEAITDEAWRKLDPGRKELLLPLADARAMSAAARRVVDLKLTQRATRELVRSMRQQRGDATNVRITRRTFERTLKKFGDRLSRLQTQGALESLARRLERDERAALLAEVEAMETLLRAVARTMRESAPKR